MVEVEGKTYNNEVPLLHVYTRNDTNVQTLLNIHKRECYFFPVIVDKVNQGHLIPIPPILRRDGEWVFVRKNTVSKGD